VAVGGVPGDEEEQDAGKKLCEADEAEVERSVRDFVDLPADGDRLHLERGHDEEARDLVEREVGIRERAILRG
jgi:hypothetical protein